MVNFLFYLRNYMPHLEKNKVTLLYCLEVLKFCFCFYVLNHSELVFLCGVLVSSLIYFHMENWPSNVASRCPWFDMCLFLGFYLVPLSFHVLPLRMTFGFYWVYDSPEITAFAGTFFYFLSLSNVWVLAGGGCT